MITKLIVGLGNIGPKYTDTRHNLGMMVADQLAENWGIEFNLKKKLQAELATYIHDNQSYLIGKPQTMMNLSGQAVAALVHFYQLDTSDLIIIHDEIDLDFGLIRVKRGGGSGGHKGVQSIIEKMGSDFWRVRLGVANPSLRQQIDPELFVLQHFDKIEQKSLNLLVTKAANHLAEAILNSSIAPASVDLR